MPGKPVVRDVVSLGYLPMRHEDSGFDVGMRIVTFGCRVGGPTNGTMKGVDAFGRAVGETVANGGTDDTYGDILGWTFWPKDTRDIGAWSSLYPAKITSTTGGAGGIPQAQPIWKNDFSKDTRFKVKDVNISSAYTPAVDDVGIVVCGTHEFAQQDLFLPTLVAGPWKNEDNWYDVTGKTYYGGGTTPFAKRWTHLTYIEDPGTGQAAANSPSINPVEIQSGTLCVSTGNPPNKNNVSSMGAKYISIGWDPKVSNSAYNAIVFQTPSSGPSFADTHGWIVGEPSGSLVLAGGHVEADGLAGTNSFARVTITTGAGKSRSGIYPELFLEDNTVGGVFSYLQSPVLSLKGLKGTITIDDTYGIGLNTTNNIAFFGPPLVGAAQQTVTGSRAAGVALANLLTALGAYNLIIDGTTP